MNKWDEFLSWSQSMNKNSAVDYTPTGAVTGPVSGVGVNPARAASITAGLSTDQLKNIAENYKKGLTGLYGNMSVGVATGAPETGNETQWPDEVAGYVQQNGMPQTAPAGNAQGVNINTGKLEFDAWKSQYGVDTDANFQSSAAQLDYEMKTWAANYGANAERLARMGLSNSGVVDVYGTGVVQAYLSAMNDLYLAKAEGDRMNADAYKQYSDQYEADLAARTQTFNDNVTKAYAYGLELYDGNNINAVATMMSNAGYDAEVVAQAVARLGAVDPSMLPALQKQAAQDQTDINTAIDQLIKTGYTEASADAARSYYKSKGWSDEKIEKVISGANGLLGLTPQEQSDKVVDTYNQIISSKSGYNSAMKGQISQQLLVNGWQQADVDRLIGLLDDYEAAGKSGAGDQELIAGVKAVKDLFYDDKGNYAYMGSDAQKESIRQQLRGTAYETMTEQIISQMDADLASIKSAAADDTVSQIDQIDIKNLTVSGMASDLERAAAEYGVDSEEYKKIQRSYSDKISGALAGIFDYGADIDSYGSLVGANAEEWATMDDSAKVDALYNALGNLHKEGYMTDEAYYSLTDKLVKNEIMGVLGSVTKTSFRELSDVLLMCKNYLNAGYIDQKKYNEYRSQLIGPIDDLDARGASDQYGAYPHAEFVVNFGGKDFKLDVFANETPVGADEYEKMNEHRGANEVFDYNGKLYVWIPGAKGETRGSEWERDDMIYPLRMNVAATGQGKGDESQLNAMYELLWYYIKSYDQ